MTDDPISDDPVADPWHVHRAALGSFLRAQRNLAKLSLREMADRTKVSNAYLSQIERGLHAPSVRVLRSIAEALDLSAEAMLAHAGLVDAEAGSDEDEESEGAAKRGTEAAIRRDPALTDDQKEALLTVYRSYRNSNRRG